jgi:hypothetical protein
MIPVIAGCQPQSVENQEMLPAKTADGPLTLEITSPEEGEETTWGFTRVIGTVSLSSAVVTIDNEGHASVKTDGSFESDYIVLRPDPRRKGVIKTAKNCYGTNDNSGSLWWL